MKAAPAIGFACRTSPTLATAVILVASLAIVATWLTRGPTWLHVALTVLIPAGCGISLERQLRPRLRALLWRADGGVDLTLAKSRLGTGREVQGEIRSARVMGPLIVLALRWPPRKGASIWLLPDNLDADTHRRLRMRLHSASIGPASGNADK